MMGGIGLVVPYSGKNVRSPFLAAVGPTGSIYYFIVSYDPLAKYTEKKKRFYSAILLLSGGKDCTTA